MYSAIWLCGGVAACWGAVDQQYIWGNFVGKLCVGSWGGGTVLEKLWWEKGFIHVLHLLSIHGSVHYVTL